MKIISFFLFISILIILSTALKLHYSGSIDLNEFRTAQLNKHNYYRSLHHTEDLELSDSLNAKAQKYSRYLASIKTLKHSSGNNYGQNLYMYGSSGNGASYALGSATSAWYDQIKFYNWNKPEFSMQTGHFTQAIWKGSKSVGFGISQVYDGKYTWFYIVANYSPAGNIMGQFQVNVLKK